MGFIMKIFTLLLLNVFLSLTVHANTCADLKEFAIQNIPSSHLGTTELYQCKLSSENYGQIFSEESEKPGSIRVKKSSACITMTYTGIIPTVLVQDSASGFNLIKLDNSGNSVYGNSIVTAAIIDDENDTVTRVDFDKESKTGHLTKWKNGLLSIFGNNMLYNYYIDCQGI